MLNGECREEEVCEELPRLVPGISTWPFFPDRRDVEGNLVEDGTSIVGSLDLDRFITVPNRKMPAVEKLLRAVEHCRTPAEAAAMLRRDRLEVDVRGFCAKLSNAGLVLDERGEPAKPDSDLERKFVRLASVSLRPLGPALAWTGRNVRVILAAIGVLAAGLIWLGAFRGVDHLSRFVPEHGFRMAFTPGEYMVGLLLLGGSFFLHELSHGVVAARFGLLPRRFELGLYLGFLPTFFLRIGGLYTLPPWQRVAVWSAGSAANLLIAAAAALGAIHAEGSAAVFWTRAAYVNLFLGLFNLFPFLPTDGYFIASTLLRRSNLRKQAWSAFRGFRAGGERPPGLFLAYVAGGTAAVVILLSNRLARILGVFPEHPVYATVRLLLITFFIGIVVMRWKKSRTRRPSGESGRLTRVGAILFLALASGNLVYGQPSVEQARRLVTERRDAEEAQKALRAVLARDPAQAEANHLLASVLYDLRKYPEAEPFAERAVAANARNSDARLLRGKIYAAQIQKAGMLGKMDLLRKAQGEFEAAVAADPRNVRARKALAGLLAEAPGLLGGSMEKAMAQAGEIEKIDAAEGHLVRADLYGIQKKPREVEQECRRAGEAAAQRAEVWARAGSILRLYEQPDKSWSYFEKAVALDPRNALAGYHLARRAIDSGKDLDKAEAWLRLNLERWPTEDGISWASTHWRLGQLYAKQGRREPARRELEAALKLKPDLKGAREDLERLK